MTLHFPDGMPEKHGNSLLSIKGDVKGDDADEK